LSMRGSTDWLGAFIRKSSKRVHTAAAAPRSHDRVPLHAADFCTSLLIVD
jgi:hypothetical protein